jgi:hypothetical protein
MRATDRVYRVNGVRPSRRALAILPRASPVVTISYQTHSNCPFQVRQSPRHARGGFHASFLRSIGDGGHRIRRSGGAFAESV